MAGDVYTHAPYVGRGGWSWYTGAAAWMHRAAMESMFGLAQRAGTLSLTPCLPSHWQACELTLRRDGRTLRFSMCRSSWAPEGPLSLPRRYLLADDPVMIHLDVDGPAIAPPAPDKLIQISASGCRRPASSLGMPISDVSPR